MPLRPIATAGLLTGLALLFYSMGLGAAALKKLELARALATKPRLLLADESHSSAKRNDSS